MSIMEKNLPIAESLGEGDKLRVVTSEGNSKNVPVSAVGGGDVFVVTVTTDSEDQNTKYFDKSASEIYNAIEAGKSIVLHLASSEGFYTASIDYYAYYEDSGYEVSLSYLDYTLIKAFALWQGIDEDTQITYREMDLVPFDNVKVFDSNNSKYASIAKSSLGWQMPAIGTVGQHNSLMFIDNSTFIGFSINTSNPTPQLEIITYTYTGNGTELTKAEYSIDMTTIS